MKRATLAMLALAICGCGDGGPASSRLEPGDAVMFVSPYRSGTVRVEPGGGAYGFEVSVGDRALVEADENEPYLADPETGDRRFVRIRMLDGEHKGREGDAHRNELRQVPR